MTVRVAVLAAVTAAVMVLAACGSDTTSGLDGVSGDGTDAVGIDSNYDGTGGDGTGLDGKVDDGLDMAPQPGTFGAPCASNADCISGYCIEGPNGMMCTQTCLDECPGGFQCVGLSVGGPDVVFICVAILDRSCNPCTSDLQCSGGKCMDFGTGKYCLAACDLGQCKATYTCKDMPAGDQTTPLCAPTSGTCECVPASVGLEKACKAMTGGLTCYGVQFCTETGWDDCQLPDEVCDGKDNDCNGIVDDGMLNPQTKKYDTIDHCGACDISCKVLTAAHAAGTCDATGLSPACKWTCDDGFFDVNANPADGCECEYLSAADDPDQPGDSNCDGIDGVVSQGIFVAKNGHDGNTGTIDNPVLTFEQGITLASDTGKPNVYVATGVWVESISLLPGINLYGGYSQDFKVRQGDLNQTAIMGMPFVTELPGAVNAVDIIDIPTVFSGFHVFGADAVDAGGTTYAVYVRNCNDALKIRSNALVAGNGRSAQQGIDGLDGENGVDGTKGGAAKDLGKEGCDGGNWTAAGLGGQKQCSGELVSGGDGGTAVCPDYDESGGQPKSSPYDQTQKPDEFGKGGQGPNPGTGGVPGFDSLIWDGAGSNCGICNVPKKNDGAPFLNTVGELGKNGADGQNGTSGIGCQLPAGSLLNGLWTGTPGATGTLGQNGSGGGGGGAGGGTEVSGCSGTGDAKMKNTDVGGSGGGGGSGGCYGSAGSGGEAGGGSFGLFMVYDGDPVMALPVIENNFIQTGFGGDGGNGGSGGVGGTGGKGLPGGNTGEGNAWCADAGGFGGDGGRGGHGGGGGGGCGGPAFGLALFGADASMATSYPEANDFLVTGTPGQGGDGGKSLGEVGQPGQAGAGGATNL